MWYYWINPLSWSMYGLMGTQLANINIEYTFFTNGATLSVRDTVLTIFGYHYWTSEVISTVFLLFTVLFFSIINVAALRFLDHQRLYSRKTIA